MITKRAPKTSSKGIVMGTAYKIEETNLLASMYEIEDKESEKEKYKESVEFVSSQIEKLADHNEIFAAHLELVSDMALMDGIISKIDQGINAQKALELTVNEFITIFDMMEDEYMKERASDIKDVGNRLMRRLKGINEQEFSDITEPVILVAKDLAPSDTAKLDLNNTLGFITQLGGVTSHVCIMARSWGIPALVGVESLMDDVNHGDFIIMDAGTGDVFINPDHAIKEEYKQRAERFLKQQKELEKCAKNPATSTDGHTVKVCANVGNVEDVKRAAQCHIDGIGLFRSEFLYMENDHFPTEEEQFEVYKEAAQNCEHELIIRTLDIGGDKELPYYTFEFEENPFLGWRAIRICLELEEVFKAQLRALLRASAFGDIWIMYPMIISVEELIRANEILETCKEELRVEGKEFRENVKVGMMIETPASVLSAKYFAKMVDFFSIGTNDLTQYLLAVDRGNKKIAKTYNSFHPAVLHAIKQVIDAGHEAGIQVGMCGEFASDVMATNLLFGMGLDEFSVAAGEVASVKHAIQTAAYEECKKIAEKVSEVYTIEEVMEILKNS
ncbi:MAG: phosphoenolpyruvate--protein phosphotransferase [Lachnospiraceae bacterium]